MILSEIRIQNQQKLRSLGSCFSKIYEKILRSQLRFYLDKFLSEFISEFRDGYSSYHFLIRFIENWIKALGPI